MKIAQIGGESGAKTEF